MFLRCGWLKFRAGLTLYLHLARTQGASPMSPIPGPGRVPPPSRNLGKPPSSPAELEAQVLEQRADELREAQAPFARILRCYDEATLFISTSGRAMTAWRWRVGPGKWKVIYESGFEKEPSAATMRAMGQ